MEEWIIEADIYRLQKELREGPLPDQRLKLLALLQNKETMLRDARNQADGSEQARHP